MWRGQVKVEDRAESDRETGKSKEDVERYREGGRESERGRERKTDREARRRRNFQLDYFPP
jgi:hypothetical protein